jgi:hypothetical protein
MDLSPAVAALAAADGRRPRPSIRELRAVARRAVEKLALDPADTIAAEPRDGFDLPLPEGRRRFLHRFVGVDRHLGPDAVGREDADAWTANLLRIAAAVRIESLDDDGTLKVTVANLATGHNLPAGFAFAREIWLEVAVATRGAPGAWTVVSGGREGRPLRDDEPLDRRHDPRLRNFQAVLFDEHGTPDDLDARAGARRGAETPLQNEATAVLKGGDAVKAGFTDRVGPLAPGKQVRLSYALGEGGRGWSTSEVGAVRVRLRFRSLPPEFLERLARRFDARAEAGNASRARDLARDLKVFEMAEDVLDVR